MMNRGLMKRQMFARGGPVRMQQGGLAGISSSLQNANQSLGTAQQQLQQAIGGNGGMGSPMGGIMGLQAPQQRRSPPAFSDMVGNPMARIGAIQNQLAAPNEVASPVGMAEGGAAFPDLTGDGEVTYADILKGRGVQMQMGGEPMAAQQAAMMQAPMPQDPTMESAAAEATKMGINPSDVEGMLNQVSEGIGNLDDAEDFEQVINSMRGDEAPLSERYGELAELVGEEDAKATPESVLTLVQPIVQIAQIDQGIGGLAQEEMSAPVEGNMAGGIMSTVNMGEEVPAPVNFNQGGPVVAMANGGNPVRPFYDQALELRQSILSPESQQQSFEDQKRMTQAQMLFDIAQGALAFATPGERQMSAAERLAQVAQPVVGSIGARAGELQKFKQGQEAEDRAMKLSALTSAETQLAAQQDRDFRASESALARAQELLVQERNLEFKEKSQESDQDFRSALLDQQAKIDIAAAALANVNSQEALKLKAELDRKAIQLQSTLRRHEISMGLQNDLKKMKVANTYDLEKMEKGLEFNKDLANHRAGLEEIGLKRKWTTTLLCFLLKILQIRRDKLAIKNFNCLSNRMHKILPVIKMLLIEQWKQHNEKSTTLSKRRLMKGRKKLSLLPNALKLLMKLTKQKKLQLIKPQQTLLGWVLNQTRLLSQQLPLQLI